MHRAIVQARKKPIPQTRSRHYTRSASAEQSHINMGTPHVPDQEPPSHPSASRPHGVLSPKSVSHHSIAEMRYSTESYEDIIHVGSKCVAKATVDTTKNIAYENRSVDKPLETWTKYENVFKCARSKPLS